MLCIRLGGRVVSLTIFYCVHLLVGEQQFVSLDDQIVLELPGLAHHRARRARLGCRKCKVQMIQKVQI